MPVPTDERGSFWYLEGFIDSGHQAWRTVLDALPMLVGRAPEAGLRLYSGHVSNRHAELFRDAGGLWLRDLASTNGTRVNLEPLTEPVQLTEGDLIHFGDLEFRLAVYRPHQGGASTATRALSVDELSGYLLAREGEFGRMLRSGTVFPLFQPVVSLTDGSVHGFELLSRGLLEGLEASPAELFFLAERTGKEFELSDLFRRTGLAAAERLAGTPLIFINTHPAELRDPDPLLDSLTDLRQRHPDVRLTLEIHEAAVTHPATLQQLRQRLNALGIRLAFDDFGTGQSRLLEIAEVPPDFVKFDMGFARGLHRAPQRREVLEKLVRMTRDAGITPVAEGIETPDEESACREVGFEFAQGFLLGMPEPPVREDG